MNKQQNRLSNLIQKSYTLIKVSTYMCTIMIHVILFQFNYYFLAFWCFGLITLNNAKSGQASTNNEIITQNIFNASVLKS